MDIKEMEMYDLMVECGVATADELNLAYNLVGGRWEDLLNQVCYIRTGYRTFDDWYFEDEDA